MEESRRLVVRGFVQGVGYRAFVKQTAYRFRIKGTAQNLRDGSVEIYARAEPEALIRFKEFLLSQSPGEVEDIEEYPEGSENYGTGPEDWIGFNILRDDYSSLEESMEYVVLGGVRLEKEMKKGFSELGSKIDILSEKTDKGFSELGEKIDKVAEKVDTVGNKIDTLSEKTDKGFSELGEKIDTGFSELGNKIDDNSAESIIRLDTIGQNTGELNEKIDKLSGELPVVVEKVDRFREDTIGAFGELDRKYHVISQNLERLNTNIEKMVDDLGILIREFVAEKRRNEGLK